MAKRASAVEIPLVEHSVPTFHPSYIGRDKRKFEGCVMLDMDRALKLARREWAPKWDRSKYITGPSLKTTLEVLKGMAVKGRRVSYDIETDGGHPYKCHVRCIAFHDGTRTLCVPFLYRDGTWTEKQWKWDEDDGEHARCSNPGCKHGANGKPVVGNVAYWFGWRYGGKYRQPQCYMCRTGKWPVDAKRGWEKKMNWLPWFTPDQEEKVYAAMQKLFDVCKLETQNGQYDRLCLELRKWTARATARAQREKFPPRKLKRPFVIPSANKNGNFDSILGHHIVASYFPHNLNFIAGIYTEVPYYKTTDEGDAWSASSDFELWDYACDDVVCQYTACTTIRNEVQERPEDVALYDHDSWYEEQAQRWKRVGFPVDWRAVELFRLEYRSKKDRALKCMRELLEKELAKSEKSTKKNEQLEELLSVLSEKLTKANKGFGKSDHDEGDYDEAAADDAAKIFNPASLAQLRLLLRHLGVPLTQQTATGDISTKKDFLLIARKELVARGEKGPALAFLDFLFAWRECAKMESTYLYPDLIEHGGGRCDCEEHVDVPLHLRVHGTFNVHVVPTGRLSGSDPNLTNQPGEIRGMFIAALHHYLVTGDWSALEMRLNGLVTGDEAMIQLFKEFDSGIGLKPHIVNASRVFNLPATKDFEKKYPGMYRAAKVFAYLLGYGGGAKACYEKMLDEMPDMKWDDFLICFDRYRKSYPTFFKNQRDIVLLGTQQRYLDTPVSGRRCHYYEDVRGGHGGGEVVSTEAESMQNMRFQGGGADVVGRANRRMVDRVLEPMREEEKLDPEQHAQVHDELLFGVPKVRCETFVPEFKAVCEEEVIPGWNLPVEVHVCEPLAPHAPSRWKPCFVSCQACGKMARAEYAKDGVQDTFTIWDVVCEKNEKCEHHTKPYQLKVAHGAPEVLQ